MKLDKVSKISSRIIFIFVCGMIMSTIPEFFPDIFGDELCNGIMTNLETGKPEYYHHYGNKHKDIETHWGYRHWLFFFMGVSLFITQAISLIIYINKKEN